MSALEAALIIALGFLVTNLVIVAFIHGAAMFDKEGDK